MDVASRPMPDPHALARRREERAAAGIACGAHALHDGYTDLIYVMLPIWQREFGLGYAELGLLRGLFAGTMASFQIPAGLIAERLGAAAVLALGTALAGLGYCLAGDIGKMTLPAVASLLLVVMAWRPALALLGALGLAAAAVIFLATPRYGPEPVAAPADGAAATRAGGTRYRFAFPVLLSIGMLDSATRMGFLLFLPFVLTAKGASLPTVGLALTLVFAGGAAGKLVCAFIGARLGVITTVCLTEGLTTAGIFALLPLPLEAALIVLPVIGIML